MTRRIQDTIQPWDVQARKTGAVVHDRVQPHLKGILLEAYRKVDPSMITIPDEVYAAENQKFRHIAQGDFSQGYFDLQAQVTQNVAEKTDYATYLQGYGVYCGKIVSTLMRESQSDKLDAQCALAESAIASVFADVAVTMSEYFAREAQADQAAQAALGQALKALAQMDLTYRVGDDAPAKIAAARQDYNTATHALEQTMRAIHGNTAEVGTGVSDISRAISELSDRNEQQANMLERVTNAIGDVSRRVKKNATSAREANGAAEAATAMVNRSSEIMVDAQDAMGSISNSSDEIGKIVSVIDDISMQTNLLALNAAVEAARAGEAGAGFAVVAQEVRQLARRTADGAKTIRDLIHASSQHVGRGAKLIDEIGVALKDTTDQVTKINDLLGQIASRAESQAASFQEINDSVNKIEGLTHSNASMAAETRTAMAGLDRSAEQLTQHLGKFRLSHQPGWAGGGYAMAS